MNILFEDSWLVAVEKPPGLLSQPGLGVEQQDSLIGRLQVAEPQLRLVHRLDRDT
ncbi:MAG: RluA family pseudouridine synthase, partial [Prochlorococcus sp.]|nr:RluA family pseudouridine synthase [Prochlorococcus sp.]